MSTRDNRTHESGGARDRHPDGGDRQASGPLPSPDPRAGENPGYDESQPRRRDEADEPVRGEYAGKRPNPEVGGLDRPPGADPDPTGEA